MLYQNHYIYHWTSKEALEQIMNDGKLKAQHARNKGEKREVKGVFLTKYNSPQEVKENLGGDIFLEVRISIPVHKLDLNRFANKNANYHDGEIKYDRRLSILVGTGEIAYLDDIILDSDFKYDCYHLPT